MLLGNLYNGELVLNKLIVYSASGANVRVDSFCPKKAGVYRLDGLCYASNGTPASSGDTFYLTVIDPVAYYDAKIVPEKTHYTVNYPKETSFRLNFTISVNEYPYSQDGLQRVWFTSKEEKGTEMYKEYVTLLFQSIKKHNLPTSVKIILGVMYLCIGIK